jgi:hypothetical protein
VGLKSKVHVAQNWPNLEKRTPFLHFSSKLSDWVIFQRWPNLCTGFDVEHEIQTLKVI